MLGGRKNNLGYLIWRLSKLWQTEAMKVLGKYELTLAQMEMLGCIYHLKEVDKIKNITQIHLSKVSAVDPMTTSTILRVLEKKGYITRAQSETDTRSKYVNITPNATGVCYNVYCEMADKKKEIFDTMPDKGVNILKEMQKLLEALENNLLEDGASSNS